MHRRYPGRQVEAVLILRIAILMEKLD